MVREYFPGNRFLDCSASTEESRRSPRFLFSARRTRSTGERSEHPLTQKRVELPAVVPSTDLPRHPISRIVPGEKREGERWVLFLPRPVDWKSRESQEIKGSLSAAVKEDSISRLGRGPYVPDDSEVRLPRLDPR